MNDSDQFENLSFSFFNSDQYKDSALEVLKSVFGHNEFRLHQEKIINEILEGRDVLALMPTGGGKSLCYQIPALVRDGVGIVISPLISLMEDQVSTLNEMGVRAAYLNSSLSRDEGREIEEALVNEEIDLLYLAPERLLQPYTLRLLSSLKVSVIAIDEAHCVSKWGPDFRPEYMNLSVLKSNFEGVPRIALTATADINSRKTIAKELGLENARVFLSSFDRENISYEIELKNDDPQVQLLNFLERFDVEDSGIVYCLSRRKVEETATFLSENGFVAYGYHAGMSASKRKKVQNEFLSKEGVIIVATIAFGMGIDKPDVRFVAHLDLPKSIESYYQETGRAGRDGLSACAWMVYCRRDSAVLKHLVRKGTRSIVQRRVEEHHIELMLGLCETTRCRREVVLNYLDEDYPEYCGNCDICQGSLEGKELLDITDEMVIYLSSIYRVDQKMSIELVLAFLMGEEDFKYQEYMNLPNFGQGSGVSLAKWKEIHRIALASGLVDVKFDKGSSLVLTKRSLKVLEGEDKVYMRTDLTRSTPPKIRKPKAPRKKRAPRKAKTVRTRSFSPVTDFTMDTQERVLFEKLRELRRSIAKSKKIPAYKIFHDTTLLEIVKSKPSSAKEFSELHGVGKAKLKKYSKKFMDLL